MKLNKQTAVYTAEGGRAVKIDAERQLRRSVAACMLWEKQFYESGEQIADRIQALVPQCRPEFVAACAFEARTKMRLRHVPLLLVACMAKHAKHAKLVSKLLPDVIQRADELSEFVAIYAKVNGVTPNNVKKKLSAQVKLGLASAFQKFDEYALAKYNKDADVKLRDVLFLCHAKPKDAAQDALWKRLIGGKLASPETWENRLSRGEDKKAVFEEMLSNGQLGALAFLRNLRNMTEAGVSRNLIEGYASAMKTERVLPYRFISAARAAPTLEPVLEKLMLSSLEGKEKFAGRTVVLLDVSGSMTSQVSGKSDITRLDAACGVGILLRELCEDVRIFTFSDAVVEVPARRGFALRDAVISSQQRGGTRLGKAVAFVNTIEHDRLIVLTDEQSSDKPPAPVAKGYVINVASNQNGVGYGPWRHIDGWSEAVLDYVHASEQED